MIIRTYGIKSEYDKTFVEVDEYEEEFSLSMKAPYGTEKSIERRYRWVGFYGELWELKKWAEENGFEYSENEHVINHDFSKVK